MKVCLKFRTRDLDLDQTFTPGMFQKRSILTLRELFEIIHFHKLITEIDPPSEK